MSHISSYQTEIRLEPAAQGSSEAKESRQLLRDAVAAVAEERNGFVSEEISDYFGRKTRVDVALVTKVFPAGIGLRVHPETGEVEFLYDAYGGYKRVIDNLCEEIGQNYTALAVTRALQDLHYEVDYEETAAESSNRRRIVVRGVL
ncbi:MAG: hypothetical protein WD535_03230 [Thermaerobacterales bacterium]